MKKIWIIMSYLLSPILIILVLYRINSNQYTTIENSIAMVLGVFSYTWMLWQLIISARPKFIEKQFALDKMYRFHGLIAIFAIAFALVHKIYKLAVFRETVVTTLGYGALNIFMFVSLISFVFMWQKLQNKVTFIRRFAQKLKSLKVLTYEKLKVLHNLTIVAIVLMQIHVLMTNAAKNSIVVFNMYMVYFLLAVGFYIYHKSIKLWLLEEKYHTVLSVIQENANTLSVVLVPSALYTIDYKPGQFAYFTFYSKHLPVETHPFSLSSSPTDQTKLIFTAKILGDFTAKLNLLERGDRVLVEGPFGAFSHLMTKEEDATVFIAGGIGITPIISMIDSITVNRVHRPIILIWAVARQSDLIQYKHLSSLVSKIEQFEFIPIVSKEDQWTGLRGRLNKKLLKQLLLRASFVTTQTGFYLCGSPNFMQSVRRDLNSLGIERKQVYYEKFTV